MLDLAKLGRTLREQWYSNTWWKTWKTQWSLASNHSRRLYYGLPHDTNTPRWSRSVATRVELPSKGELVRWKANCKPNQSSASQPCKTIDAQMSAAVLGFAAEGRARAKRRNEYFRQAGPKSNQAEGEGKSKAKASVKPTLIAKQAEEAQDEIDLLLNSVLISQATQQFHSQQTAEPTGAFSDLGLSQSVVNRGGKDTDWDSMIANSAEEPPDLDGQLEAVSKAPAKATKKGKKKRKKSGKAKGKGPKQKKPRTDWSSDELAFGELKEEPNDEELPKDSVESEVINYDVLRTRNQTGSYRPK